MSAPAATHPPLSAMSKRLLQCRIVLPDADAEMDAFGGEIARQQEEDAMVVLTADLLWGLFGDAMLQQPAYVSDLGGWPGAQSSVGKSPRVE